MGPITYPDDSVLVSTALTVFPNGGTLGPILQQLTLGMMGLPVDKNSAAVRLDWATEGQPFSQPNEDVCYIRMTLKDDPYDKIRERTNLPDADPNLNEQWNYTRVWSIGWVFYGPNASDFARLVRSGLFQEYFLNILSQSELFPMPDIAQPLRVPEKIGSVWYERADLECELYEFVTENIQRQTIASAEVIVVTPGIASGSRSFNPSAVPSVNLDILGTDLFQIPDGPLGSAWTVAPGAIPGPPVIPWDTAKVVNHLVRSSGVLTDPVTGEAIELFTGVTLPSDQFSEVTIANLLGGSSIGAIVRADPSTWFCYELLLTQTAPGVGTLELQVWNAVNGTPVVPFLTSLNFAPGDKMLLAAVGNRLWVLYNGNILGSVVDNTHASGITAFDLQPTGDIANAQISGYATGHATASTSDNLASSSYLVSDLKGSRLFIPTQIAYLRSVPDAASNNLAKKSVSAWIYLKSLPAAHHYFTVLSKDPLNSDAFFFGVANQDPDTGVAFGVAGNNHDVGVASNILPPLNTWMHICGTYDDATGTMKLYINGVDVTNPSTNFPGQPIDDSGGGWFIGNDTLVLTDPLFERDNFDGFIAEVGIWNRVLTPAEVLQVASVIDGSQVAAANLVEYWHLTGQNPEPNSVTGHPVQTPSNVGTGPVPKSVSPSDNLPQESIAFWVRVTEDTVVGANTFANLVIKDGLGVGDRNIFLGNENAGVTGISAAMIGPLNGTAVSVGAKPALNTWMHVCVTYDDSTGACKLYINGVDSTSITENIGGGEGDDSTGGWFIGNLPNAFNDPQQREFSGDIAQVGIWNRVLTPTEVKALAAVIDGSNIASDSLVEYWPLLGQQSPEPNSVSGPVQILSGNVLPDSGPAPNQSEVGSGTQEIADITVD